MKVENMTSSNGNKVANQFIITDDNGNKAFQSYNSVIVKKPADFGWSHEKNRRMWGLIELDYKYWDYSKTTSKYRNQFLGETKAETQKKIDSGEYVLTDLN